MPDEVKALPLSAEEIAVLDNNCGNSRLSRMYRQEWPRIRATLSERDRRIEELERERDEATNAAVREPTTQTTRDTRNDQYACHDSSRVGRCSPCMPGIRDSSSQSGCRNENRVDTSGAATPRAMISIVSTRLVEVCRVITAIEKLRASDTPTKQITSASGASRFSR